MPRLHKVALEHISYPAYRSGIPWTPYGFQLSTTSELRRESSQGAVLSQLDHLRIGANLPEDMVVDLVDWLVSASACRSIRTLEVWQADWYIIPVNKLLEAIGPSLLRLQEDSKVTDRSRKLLAILPSTNCVI